MWKFNTFKIHKEHFKFYNSFPSSLTRVLSSAPGKVVNLTVEALNYSAVNLIWYLPRQPNGKITSFKISVKHARSGIVVKDVSIKVEDILTGKLPECNVSVLQHISSHQSFQQAYIFKFSYFAKLYSQAICVMLCDTDSIFGVCI